MRTVLIGNLAQAGYCLCTNYMYVSMFCEHILLIDDHALLTTLSHDCDIKHTCIQRKIFFRATIFLYSLCPNLEDTKDALCYKFRRPTIGQNCSAVCTNKGGHRDAFSNERRKAPRVLRGLLSMQAMCHRASSEARDEVYSLP